MATENHMNHQSSTFNFNDFIITIENATVGNNQEPPRRPLIQKVLQKLRDVQPDENCYDPSVVSIGPYHRGKPQFQKMEKVKRERANQLLSSSRCNVSFRDLCNRVYLMVTELRACYADHFYEFDDYQFTAIMVLDGCFILNFICYWLYENLDEERRMRDTFIMRDLFLLENQLPFVLLQELMSKIYIGDIRNRTNAQQVELTERRVEEQNTLKFFIDHQTVPPEFVEGADQQYEQPFHLLDCLRTRLGGVYERPAHEWGNYQWIIRSVKELKAAGVVFKKCEYAYFLSEIIFTPGLIFAEFQLPSIAVNNSTKSMLLNLAAYEMCPDAFLDYEIMSYICLMDELINDVDDVKELRSKGILLNFLGSDQQLADLFNQMSIGLVADPKIHCNVKVNMDKHYNKKFALAIVSFLNTNFTSWTSIGVTAASLALILTFIQTYFAVFPRGYENQVYIGLANCTLKLCYGWNKFWVVSQSSQFLSVPLILLSIFHVILFMCDKMVEIYVLSNLVCISIYVCN